MAGDPPRRPARRPWWVDRGGNVALIFALLMPGLMVTGLGAIELNQVLSDRKRTQDVADAAALMGASQLGVSPVGAAQRTQSYALTQLTDVEAYASVSAQATVGPVTSQGATLSVAIDTQRASFFGNLLPLGGFHTHVTSTAVAVSSAPLCVLGLSTILVDAVHITGTSQLQAGQCLVHSDSALTADASASILASANEAVTLATGSINATPSLLAPIITDPFASLNVNPSSCSGTGTPLNVSGGASQTLAAGVHTGPVIVSGGSTLTLGSGDHYFCKTVTVSGGSTLAGTDVDLIFDAGANFTVNGAGSTVNLGGRQSGPLAGFVLIADRKYTGTFTLSSDFITNLTGTVYVPTATLAVTGTAKSGATSPWTVIVAQNFTVNGSAQLVINANYAASSVPVPLGVGDQRNLQNAKLTQ